MLDIMRGVNEVKFKKTCTGTLTRNIPSSAGRTDLVRVKLKSTKIIIKLLLSLQIRPITTLIGTQGYLEIPPHKEGLEKGSSVEAILELRRLGNGATSIFG